MTKNYNLKTRTDKVQELLTYIEQNQNDIWNISPDAGMFLSIIVKLKKPKNILEIGTAQGYSTIWLANSLKETNPLGKLTTIETSPRSIKLAKENFKKSNLNNINLLEGNAIEIIDKLNQKEDVNNFNKIPLQFDLVFIDARKDEYLQYLKKLESNNLLSKNHIIIADDVISHKERLQNYLDYVQNNSNYKSTTINIDTGMEISIKQN
ncbi:methyltransferase domain-containing protein [Candidatus Woesearchaeota archaeon]|jgi:predicted O-methyltransferase YrrM|nr:methyltransferase domain-containing protein [Candidatus Woesearchaeota archaeon]MBT6519538.1 methyltransferase domain-containing protein [Candidatus Woesearchaeota archaeon]MBT7367717.1 methyltransferase domain-containing protein [Candidatus Woesearchaeota archaeon]